LKEPRLSSTETNCYLAEIERLRQKGALVIAQPSKNQFLSPFFLAKKSSGGMRLILNLRDLNAYIRPPHFKMEDWRTVIRLMTQNCKMASIDLEDAYLLIPIHPPPTESFFASNTKIEFMNSRLYPSAYLQPLTYSLKLYVP